MSRREYKTGTAWCLWRWKDVLWQEELYLRRLILVQTPWFSIMLHFIESPDMQQDLHDHPVSFFSFILKGYYVEDTGDGQMYVRSLYNWVPATTKHQITALSDGGVVTLCFAGPRVRDWGFHTNDGWVYWKDYHKTHEASTT